MKRLGLGLVARLAQTDARGKLIPLFVTRNTWALIIVSSIATVSASVAVGEDSYELIDGRVVSPLEIFQECDVCPEMIVLPTGSFMMGAPPEESAAIDFRTELPPGEVRGKRSEGPVHQVTIDLPFAMGRNEVTYDDWIACVDDGGCSHMPPTNVLFVDGWLDIGGRAPVIYVSYDDILQYAAWINRKVGVDVYRLPTEAEWEYAARAGTTTPYAQGETLTTDQANFLPWRIESHTGFVDPDPDAFEMPIAVDLLDAANPWGLRHMSGNVMELTLSCWSSRHLELAETSARLAAAQVVSGCDRVNKGGSYSASRHNSRPAFRGRVLDGNRSKLRGFRLIREM